MVRRSLLDSMLAGSVVHDSIKRPRYPVDQDPFRPPLVIYLIPRSGQRRGLFSRDGDSQMEIRDVGVDREGPGDPDGTSKSTCFEQNTCSVGALSYTSING